LFLLCVEQVRAAGTPTPRFTPNDYGQQADDLRRALAVAQVVCVGPEGL
jgi:serine protease Do